MDILQCTATLAPEAGGIVRSVTRLSEHLAQTGLNVHLLALEGYDRATTSLIPEQSVKTYLAPCRVRLGSYPVWIPEYAERIQASIRGCNVRLVHDHGCWLPSNFIVARETTRENVAMVISPRGMLEPWSMRRSHLKKKFAWQIFQHRALEQASVLHATSQIEADNLRRLGLRRPIAVIPNGVDLPLEIHCYQSGKRTRQKAAASERTLLFLSRIHPKKGLLNLIQALKQTLTTGWRVVIAGPDENNHRIEVEAAISEAGLQGQVTFTGPVDHVTKWSLYEQADLFVLPTFSENFGNVIAEALAAGVPVITTKGAPWQDLEKYGCGWWIDIGVEPLVHALRAAMSLSYETRAIMGESGRKLVQEKYCWPDIADKMAAVYRWLLKEGDKPDCVVEAV